GRPPGDAGSGPRGPGSPETGIPSRPKAAMHILSAAVSLWISMNPVAADTAAAREYVGAAADSLAVRSDVWADSLATPRRTPSAGDVAKALAQLSPRDLVRIEGTFGRFEGRAGRVTETGFEALESHTAPPANGALRALTWEQIDRVEAHRGCGRRGATYGAIVGVGLVVALYAYASYNSADDEGQGQAYVAVGAIPTVIATTLIGALLGTAH